METSNLIFLASVRDDKALAKELEDRLTKDGYAFFHETFEEMSMAHDRILFENFEKSPLMLCVVSDAFFANEYAINLLYEAKDMGKKIVFWSEKSYAFRGMMKIRFGREKFVAISAYSSERDAFAELTKIDEMKKCLLKGAKETDNHTGSFSSIDNTFANLKEFRSLTKLDDALIIDEIKKSDTEAISSWLDSFFADDSSASEDDNMTPEELYDKGDEFHYGSKGVKDDKKAFAYYLKAAKEGYASAENKIGFMYSKGLGVEKDDKEAVKWFSKAADRGNRFAQYNLGLKYEFGQGVATDYQKAMELYQRAAGQGYVGAETKIGYMYSKGLGVEKDDKEAVKWYTKAADHGDSIAQYNLGIKYEYGRGVEKDIQKAKELYQKAAEGGSESAKKALARFDD